MSRFSIKIIFFTLSLIGFLCVPYLSYKLIPDNTYPALQVSYVWPNASQYSVEKKITSKLEGAFSTIKNLKEISSESHSDYGEIYLEYNRNVDIELERFNLSTIIRQVYSNLPEEVSYPKISYQRPEDNDVRLLSYSILSIDESSDTKNFIDKILTPKITRNEGVSSIEFEGVPSYFYQIEYDLAKIKTLKLTENEIETSIKNELYDTQIGKLLSNESNKNEELLISLNKVSNPNQILNLPLKKIKSKIVTLNDVAILTKKKQSDINLFRINGSNTTSFSVIADKTANQIKLSNTIKDNINEIKRNYPNYDFILTKDSSDFLKKELKDILIRTSMSFFFLFLLTVFIYRELKYTLNLFISLIATLLLSVIFFKLLKIEIHIYSLMSIAISIGFVIDNSIITIDHYLKNNTNKIILPIIAATLTTIAPLLLISILKDSIKYNLIDFAYTLIIILVSSLIVSFFLTPSLTTKKKKISKKRNIKRLRQIHLFNIKYLKLIYTLRKYRTILSLSFIFLFGVPFFLLPKSIDNNSKLASLYNLTFGNEYYISNIKPVTDKYLGGYFKLFIENSSDQNSIKNPKRLNVSVRINTPFGSTLNYINEVCNKFEKSLKLNSKSGIEFFQTRIYNENSAQIDIYFLPEKESSSLPFKLKGFLEKESLSMSGVDFFIFGVGKPYGSSSVEAIDGNIILTGYDYNKLKKYAQIVKKDLEKNTRIDNVLLKSETSWFVNINKKYHVNTSQYDTKMIFNNLQKNHTIRNIGFLNRLPLKISSSIKNKNSSFSILNNNLVINDSIIFKPKYDLKLDLISAPEKIVKSNQEYQLVLQYKFMGTYKHSELVKEEAIIKFKDILVSGFKIKDGNPSFSDITKSKILTPIGFCIFLIFSICTILLESFKKATLIVLIVPITFIGVFSSLYYLEIGFNQGVYGALILLVGLMVNSSIFIINEYSTLRYKFNQESSFLKAFNKKITPIIITVISTLVGLLPFLLTGNKNNFWYPFAITITIGLIFSLFIIIFVLPIYLISKKT
jgi:multidrug efflux pump subunit AcrB